MQIIRKIDVTKECQIKIYLEGENGDQKLAVEIYDGKTRVAKVNWCGGVSKHRQYDITLS